MAETAARERILVRLIPGPALGQSASGKTTPVEEFIASKLTPYKKKEILKSYGQRSDSHRKLHETREVGKQESG